MSSPTTPSTGPGPRAPAPVSSSGNAIGFEFGSSPACVDRSVGRIVDGSGDDLACVVENSRGNVGSEVVCSQCMVVRL